MNAAGHKRTQAPQPTQEQANAFAKAMQRGGRFSLTRAECEALASHPNLATVQQLDWAKLATQKAIEVKP